MSGVRRRKHHHLRRVVKRTIRAVRKTKVSGRAMARAWPMGSEGVLVIVPLAELVAAGRDAVLEGEGEIEVSKVVGLVAVVE